MAIIRTNILIGRFKDEMSMITYIGFNFTVKLSEDDAEDEFVVEYVCPDEENRNTVKQKHFTTPYIYEILESENPIWQLTDYQKANLPHNYEKSKKLFSIYVTH